MDCGAGRSRILLVEDQADLRQLMALILRRAGHDVDAVVSAAEALERLSRAEYQLVISDFWLGMPMTGMQLASAIRTTWPLVCFILVTGSVVRPTDAEMERHGIEAVLIKPFATAELRDCVSTVVQRCAERQRQARPA